MPTSFNERRPRNWHKGSSSLRLRRSISSSSLSVPQGQNKSNPSVARFRGIKFQAAPPRNSTSGLAGVPSCQMAGKGDEARDGRRGDGITGRGDGVSGRLGEEVNGRVSGESKRGVSGIGEAGTSVVSTVVSFGLRERFSKARRGRREATDTLGLVKKLRDLKGDAGAEVLTGDGERIRRPNGLKRDVFDPES